MKIYIAGPITGVKNYQKRFETAEHDLREVGMVALNPARLPLGLSERDYMRICLAMVDCADVVLLLPGWNDSAGAKLEAGYAQKAGKLLIHYPIDPNELARHLMLTAALERR